jgi:sulfite reductase (NADPH) flavoprotein alpha-component
VLIFVASEGGSTWGFAQTLHDALAQAATACTPARWSIFRPRPPRGRCLCWPPPMARARPRPTPATPWSTSPSSAPALVPVTVLGFGDRQFPAPFAPLPRRWMQTLRAQGWPALLPLECIHQQSASSSRAGAMPGAGAGRTPGAGPCAALAAHHRAHARDGAPGLPRDGSQPPTAILRFCLAGAGPGGALRRARSGALCCGRSGGHRAAGLGGAALLLAGVGLGRWVSGNLRAPVARRPVLHAPAGPAARGPVAAFIRPNPGFALPRTRRPVLLIGAGTGVAPLAGFIRRNDRHTPMHLYFGGRDPARTSTLAPRSRWLAEGRLASVCRRHSRACPTAAAMCRTPCAATPSACAAWWRRAPWCACAAAAPWHKAWPRRWTPCWHRCA